MSGRASAGWPGSTLSASRRHDRASRTKSVAWMRLPDNCPADCTAVCTTDPNGSRGIAGHPDWCFPLEWGLSRGGQRPLNP